MPTLSELPAPVREAKLESIYGKHRFHGCDYGCGGSFVCAWCGHRFGWCLQGRDMSKLQCQSCAEKSAKQLEEMEAKRRERVATLRGWRTRRPAEREAERLGSFVVRQLRDGSFVAAGLPYVSADSGLYVTKLHGKGDTWCFQRHAEDADIVVF